MMAGSRGAKLETWTSVMRDRRVRIIMHANGWLTWGYFFENVTSQNIADSVLRI
jgi:hypothetical protein